MQFTGTLRLLTFFSAASIPKDSSKGKVSLFEELSLDGLVTETADQAIRKGFIELSPKLAVGH